jgi:hypothetical protein
MERLKIYCLTYEEDGDTHSIFHTSKDYLQSLRETWKSSGNETDLDEIFEVYPKTKNELVYILTSVSQRGFYDG